MFNLGLVILKYLLFIKQRTFLLFDFTNNFNYTVIYKKWNYYKTSVNHIT